MQPLLRDACWRRSSPPLPASSLSFLQAAMQMGKPLETILKGMETKEKGEN
jgi:hypothetical protein